MNFDKEYYVLKRVNNDNYPLLDWDEDNNPNEEDGIFATDEKLSINDTISLVLGDPVPDQPEVVDYHPLPPAVFSKKIAKVLKEMDLVKTQLFPAVIRHEDRIFNDYYIFHIYNEIACMHKGRSDYEWEVSKYVIESLSLDEEILAEIEEEKRLVFKLSEKISLKLYHQTVVDKIMATKPVGLRFIRVDEWDMGSSFR